MRDGIGILAISAILWWMFAIGFGRLPLWLIVIPLLVSGLVVAWARRLSNVAQNQPGAHVGALVGQWSAIEGALIGIAVVLLSSLHHPAAILPAMAIIVGLHFLPLARGIPVRLYYATGVALILLGVVALDLPVEPRPMVVGFGASVIVWISAILLARGIMV
jgi:hypothetical protein